MDTLHQRVGGHVAPSVGDVGGSDVAAGAGAAAGSRPGGPATHGPEVVVEQAGGDLRVDSTCGLQRMKGGV